ncbi:endonuclease/exonuclease/phosphatase family protein [Histidinibacterium lentulum]|uniref:Endonuclease n=1 Tax=Histidinibacterium lentulum TaxID=2480588 RepID=A0A3N2QS75_9RHOB|nr:endonuclease/exonuclease/phosphatase family protein [Histidinibacterium lentulum]ROT98066.1 endonuclease [Histidinibacterium lentulum]
MKLRAVARWGALVLAGLALVAAVHLWRNSQSMTLPEKPRGALRVASLNVHYIVLGATEGRWSRTDWERRRAPLVETVAALEADIVALQEAESFGGGSMSSVSLHVEALREGLPGYAVAAFGDPAVFPSTQPILYDPDRLELLDEGWFFFSETPGMIYSRTFNGSFPAFASTATFRNLENGAAFQLVNVHFDWSSWENRRPSAELTAARISETLATGLPVILAGDLNARHGALTMAILEDAGLDFPDVPGGTVHFDRGLALFGAIDHIGLSGGILPAGDPVVWREKPGSAWPADHWPVVLDVMLPD